MPWKITPSLYNSWLFYRYPLFDRDEQQERDAKDEFLRALKKEKTPDTNWTNLNLTNWRVLEPSQQIVVMAYSKKKTDANFHQAIIFTALLIVSCLRPSLISSVLGLGNTTKENTKKVFNTWRICISGNQSDLTT